MTELKPCPCCGPKAFITPSTTCYAQEGPQPWSAELRCDECGLNISRTAATEKEALYEAVDAWNTRTERTCHVVIEDECPTCSECGEDIDHSFVACPYCGAKVVE